MRSLLRRARAALRRLLVTEDSVRLEQLADRLEHTAAMSEAVHHLVGELDTRVQDLRIALDEQRTRMADVAERLRAGEEERRAQRQILHAVVTEESANRRRLREVRRSSGYEAPWADPDPLVTVIVATYRRAELLVERSLPSILAQSHQNLEVIVVGDATDDDSADRVAALDDERITFVNLPHRVEPGDDPRRHHLTASTAARNEAYERATGAWWVDADDDDSFRPDAIATLLTTAREHRAEVAYGKASRHWADGSADLVGRFPPAHGHFTWMAGIRHGGLGWFTREYTAALFDLPGDWYLAERMLRCGVRFAMTDEVVSDIFRRPDQRRPGQP